MKRTKRDLERRLEEKENDEGSSDGERDMADLFGGDGIDVYYSDGDGGVFNPETGEHVPGDRVEVIEDGEGFRLIETHETDEM